MDDDLPPGVPAPQPNDSEPVRRALGTAAKLWMDGELIEAVAFVQKAAGVCAMEALTTSSSTIRARALSAIAAELDEYVKSWSTTGHALSPSTARVPSTVDSFSDLALSSTERDALEPAPAETPAPPSAQDVARRFAAVGDLRATLAQAPRPAAPSPSQPLPPPSSKPASAPARSADLPADFRRTLQQGSGTIVSAPAARPLAASAPLVAPPVTAPVTAPAAPPREPPPESIPFSSPFSSAFSTPLMPSPPAPETRKPLYRPPTPAAPQPETRRVEPIPWSDPHSSVPTQPAPEPPTTRKPAEGEEYPPAPAKPPIDDDDW